MGEHGENGEEEGEVLDEEEDLILCKSVVKPMASDFWPHPRKECSFFAFSITPTKLNVRHCGQCYCFMCDTPASECKEWEESHCNAWQTESWREKRALMRKGGGPTPSTSTAPRGPVSSPQDTVGLQDDPLLGGPNHSMQYQWGSNYGAPGYQWPMQGYHADWNHPYDQFYHHYCYHPHYAQQIQHVAQVSPLPPHLQDTPWRQGSDPLPPGTSPPLPQEDQVLGESVESQGGPEQRKRTGGQSPRRASEGDGYFEIERVDGRFVSSVRRKLRALRVDEREDPRKDTRLAHWGTLALECKVLGGREIEDSLVRFGVRGKRREADILEFCRKNKLVSLWNLNEHFAFKEIMDPRCKGRVVLPEGVERLLQELVRHSSVPEDSARQDPQMFTALRWIRGKSEVEGTLEIKVYIWKIGESLCLLNESSSTRSMDRLFLHICCHGESDAEKSAGHISKRIHQWKSTIHGQEVELSEELLNKAVKAMSYNTDNTYSDCSPLKQIKEQLPPYQVHGIQRMKQAETLVKFVASWSFLFFQLLADIEFQLVTIPAVLANEECEKCDLSCVFQELGFADKLWVELKLGGVRYWYSPFLKRIAAHSPRRQCAGGFLSEQSSMAMMLMTLGLVWENAKLPGVPLSTGLRPSRATLVVCPEHQVEGWMEVGREQVNQPFRIFEYNELGEAPDMVYRSDVVVVRYSTLCKEFLAFGCKDRTLYLTSWHRIVFSYGEILFKNIPLVEACEKVSGHFRWILLECPLSPKLKELLPKFRALNLEPWYDQTEFKHLIRFTWMPLYLMSRLVIRHDSVSE